MPTSCWPHVEQASCLLKTANSQDGRATLDYVVCNHAEPDHSGALPEVMRAFPQATLVCDAKCRTALGAALRHVGLEVPRGCQRRHALARPPHAGVPRDADGPLARVDVHLRARGETAVLDGRLRPALRHLAAVRRRGAAGRSWTRPRPTTRTSSCPTARPWPRAWRNSPRGPIG